MTKTEKLIKALRQGQEITADQAIARYGFESANSFRKAVSNLRLNEGYAIYANSVETRDGEITKYRLGTPMRAVVAAGYRALAA